MKHFWKGFEKRAKESWSSRTRNSFKYRANKAVGVPLAAAGLAAGALYHIDKKYSPKGIGG